MEKYSLPTTPKKFLVFAAHPDDQDFGCSATIARLTAEGHTVTYAILTNGEKGTHAVKQSTQEMINLREREQRNAASCAGVKEVIFLRETDGDLEHTSDVRKIVTKTIRVTKPDIVVSLDPGNQQFDDFYRFHRDHRIAAEIVFDAIYPAAGSDAFFPELTAEDILPHQIEGVWFFGTDRPNFFVDVSDFLEKKLDSLRAHRSQFVDMEAVEKKVKERARAAALESTIPGAEYAESFRCLMF